MLDELNLEEFAKTNSGAAAPLSKKYMIRIDKEIKTVSTPTITGREILTLVGKTPEGWKLYKHTHGRQPQAIEPDQVVDLREPGLERFTTMAKDHTEGGL